MLCFTVENPHRKQQNASDVSACTKRPCLKAQPLGMCREVPRSPPHSSLRRRYRHLLPSLYSSRDTGGGNGHKTYDPCHCSEVFILSKSSSRSSIKGEAKIAPNFLPRFSALSAGTGTIDNYGGVKGMCCLYPFLIAGDCKVVL